MHDEVNHACSNRVAGEGRSVFVHLHSHIEHYIACDNLLVGIAVNSEKGVGAIKCSRSRQHQDAEVSPDSFGRRPDRETGGRISS